MIIAAGNAKLDSLKEVRLEISRLNATSGETVFNPAATSALDSVIRHYELMGALRNSLGLPSDA